MTELKKGDRVRVEYEAVVVKFDDDGDVVVQEVGTISFENVSPDWCTVLVPPIKVGDMVTPENIGQLGLQSIIARPGKTPVYRSEDGWQSDGDTPLDDEGVFNVPAAEDTLVVLRVGGSS